MQPPVQLSSNPPQTIRWFHVFLSAAYRQHTLRSAGDTDVLEAILISPYRFVPLDLHDLHFHSVVADLGGKAENLLTDESFRSWQPSIYPRLDTCRRLPHEDSSPFTSETAKYALTSRLQGIFFYQGTDLHHKISNTICLLDGLIEQAAFNQALITHPKDEFASVLVGDLAQFVDTNSGVKIYGSKEEIRA